MLQDGENIFSCGEFPKNGWFLGQVGDSFSGTPVHRELGDIVLPVLNFSFGGSEQADNHRKGGCFSCAVGSEETDDFAFPQGDGNVVDDGALPELLVEILSFEYRIREAGSHAGFFGAAFRFV